MLPSDIVKSRNLLALTWIFEFGRSGAAACCHAVIHPENCVVEMERVIAEARRNNQPAYIVVPSDYALAPVSPVDVKPIELRSNDAAVRKAMASIAERIKKATSF
jgi:indolepyruvate decarboxylase